MLDPIRIRPSMILVKMNAQNPKPSLRSDLHVLSSGYKKDIFTVLDGRFEPLQIRCMSPNIIQETL